MSEKHDGGPAFPVQEPLEKYDDELGKYVTVYQPIGGMSKRDYFAGQALTGIIAAYAGPDSTLPAVGTAAKFAYDYADAMIAEGAK